MKNKGQISNFRNGTKKKILIKLLTGEHLTRYSCRDEFGTESLHSYISSLKQNGYPILSKWVTRMDAIGQIKNVKSYWIDEAFLVKRNENKVN